MKVIKLAKTLLCLMGTIPTPFLVVSCENTTQPTSIAIEFPEEIQKGDTVICSAHIEPLGANTGIIWDTSNHELATIDPNTNEFIARDNGEVIIFATSALNSNIFAYKKIRIQSIPEKISIVGDNDIALNCPQQYQVEVEPKEASQEHTWSLIDGPDVAEIDEEGNLIVHKIPPEPAQIILIAKSINEKIPYAQKLINVKPTPKSIEISGCPDKIEINKEYQCAAKCYPETTKQDVVWSVDNEEFASIEDGKLIGKKAGSVKVRAQSAVKQDIFVEKDVTIFECVPEPVDFSTDSWQTIASYLDGGLEKLKEVYKVPTFIGKTRKIKLWSASYDVRVIGEEQDVDVNGQPVALTFEFVQPLVFDCKPEGLTYFTRKYIYRGENEKNYGFWYNSETNTPSSLWKFLNEIFEEELSKAMGYTSENSIIKTVKKWTWGASKPEDSLKLMESHDKVFLLSLAEKFNPENLRKITQQGLEFIVNNLDNYLQENERYKWYSDNDDEEIKNSPNPKGECRPYEKTHQEVIHGTDHNAYFLRSINISAPAYAIIVALSISSPSIITSMFSPNAIAPAFCI